MPGIETKPFPPRDRTRQLAPLLLMLPAAAVALAAYLQALDYPFISDDVTYVTNNPKLAGLQLAELWRLFTEPYNRFEFLPLRDLSYWFDMKLFGLNPSPFRVHNIILYLLCLPLVYAATLGVWRYFRPADAAGAPWAAAAVTALFTLHPAHVEAVVWVSGRKDVLSGIFSMLALWLAVSARREQGFSASYAAAALVAFAAVMLSKASYVAVAPVIALLWLLFWLDVPAPDRRRSQLLWPLAILLLAGFMVLFFTVSSAVKTPAYFGIEAATRSLAVLGRLANIAITPEGRHFYYPVTEQPYLGNMAILGVAVLAAAFAGGVMCLRKRSLEGFALVIFFLLCIPYLQLVPFRTFALAQDRYVAFAVWPVVLLLIALSWRLKPVPRTILLLLFALPWSLQTVERPRDWRSYEAMLDADLRTYPEFYVPVVYKMLYVQLPRGLNRDAIKAAGNITDPGMRSIAIRLIQADAMRAQAINTGNLQNAMAVLQEMGQVLKKRPVQIKWDPHIRYVWVALTEALSSQWNNLAEHFPDNVSLRYNAGLWMLDIYDYKNAAAHLRAATESQHLPGSVRGAAFRNLGIALMGSGQVAEAEAPLRAALEQSQPDLAAYCLLSKMYQQTGRPEDAARAEASCPGRPPAEEIVQ